MTKRLFDILVAVIGLLLSTPIMFVVATLIAMQRDGPIMYRQVRIGMAGRHFILLKFRTMSPEKVERSLQLTIGNDARITPIGRFLRQYKVDELPQLINVLRGDMSVVGPRPETPIFVEQYPKEVRNIVLSVRPGITDLASIKYRNEAELLSHATDPIRFYSEEILPDKLAIASEYVREHTLKMDIIIIFKTIYAVVYPQPVPRPN
jgi:lipopolysaccharide/colanic/teichoic acid biosynthesis glycosyltransferase